MTTPPSTIAAACERFLRQGQASGWADTTGYGYRNYLRLPLQVLRQRGCRRVADVTPDDLQACMQHLAGLGQKASSRLQVSILLKQLFRWFQEQGLAIGNPALGLPVPDDDVDALPQPPLTEVQMHALLASLPRESWIDLRNACLIEVLYGCGLRRAEALALDVVDLDLHHHTLHVRCGKGGQARLVPLMSATQAAAQDYLAVRRRLLRGPDHGAFFVSKLTGRRLSLTAVSHLFDAINAARGPDLPHVHPHLLRHSIAVHLLRGGADIRHIQAFLGHAALDTTKIYLRLVPGRLKEDYDEAMPDIAAMTVPSMTPASPVPPTCPSFPFIR